MWQRFTERARKVVYHAQVEAQRFGHSYVQPEHFLLGITNTGGSVADRLLKKQGVTLDQVRSTVERQLPTGKEKPSQDMYLSDASKLAIDRAYEEAKNLDNNYIGTEHLLLALIRDGEGLAGKALATLRVDLAKAREELKSLLTE
jgi:ATP-dependent Clp protease ATP-binding subunit ClpC